MWRPTSATTDELGFYSESATTTILQVVGVP